MEAPWPCLSLLTDDSNAHAVSDGDKNTASPQPAILTGFLRLRKGGISPPPTACSLGWASAVHTDYHEDSNAYKLHKLGFAVPVLPTQFFSPGLQWQWLEVEQALVFQCPPCRSLTRVLVESYRKIKEAGQKFEIIFVSADRYSVSVTLKHTTLLFQ